MDKGILTREFAHIEHTIFIFVCAAPRLRRRSRGNPGAGQGALSASGVGRGGAGSIEGTSRCANGTDRAGGGNAASVDNDRAPRKLFTTACSTMPQNTMGHIDGGAALAAPRQFALPSRQHPSQNERRMVAAHNIATRAP